MSQRIHAFTFVELLVFLVIIVGMIALLLPALNNGRRPRRQDPNSTQVRGIHTGLVLFSQGNNTYYPGYHVNGNRKEVYSVEIVFQALLEENYFTGEYAISPSETKDIWTEGKVTAKNYSYAMLNLSDLESPRNHEWRDTSNSESVVISDRAIANGTGVKSVHTNPSKPNMNQWQGSVGFNDNHVTFESSHDNLETNYWDEIFKEDNLFDTQGASLIYKGVDEIVDPGL